jgi:hypothetical protein
MENASKITIIIRDNLEMWQRLNVTSFLMSGITAANPEIIGQPYRNVKMDKFLALSTQPIIILAADLMTLRTIHERAIEQGVIHAAYIEEMFSTYNDSDNRNVFAKFSPSDANLVGLGFRSDKKLIDKITKGAVRHP